MHCGKYNASATERNPDKSSGIDEATKPTYSGPTSLVHSFTAMDYGHPSSFPHLIDKLVVRPVRKATAVSGGVLLDEVQADGALPFSSTTACVSFELEAETMAYCTDHKSTFEV